MTRSAGCAQWEAADPDVSGEVTTFAEVLMSAEADVIRGARMRRAVRSG
jgi:hypothetical protein